MSGDSPIEQRPTPPSQRIATYEQLKNPNNQDISPQKMADKRMDNAERLCQVASVQVNTVNLPRERMNLDRITLPVSELPDFMKEQIVQATRTAAIKGKQIVDPQTPPAILKESNYLVNNVAYHFQASHEGQGFVEVRYGKSFWRISFRGRRARKLFEHIADPSEYSLQPWQVWATSKLTGERLWLDDTLPEPISDGIDSRANTRLGLVLATILSDKERDKLPRALSLKPGGTIQPIREAQIVILPFLSGEDIRRMIGVPEDEDVIDPHQTILNGSYFRAIERSAHIN